jgi:hypothetical protein
MAISRRLPWQSVQMVENVDEAVQSPALMRKRSLPAWFPNSTPHQGLRLEEEQLSWRACEFFPALGPTEFLLKVAPQAQGA